MSTGIGATIPAEAPRAPGRPAGAARWMAVSFGTALAVAVVTLAAYGTGKDGLYEGLRVTARVAFVPFWLAYAGGALAALFGARFQPLKRHGREFGLAFAAALLVHLGVVAWDCLAGFVPGVRTFEIFGAAAGCTYLLALFSADRLRHLPGPVGWWLLRTVGMTYIAVAFADDFLKGPLFGGIVPTAMYLPFAVLAVAGPALRLAAFARRIGHPW